MSFKDTLLHIFTWWNGANYNTRVFTARHGELVGHDEFGNTYYRMRARRDRSRPRLPAALGHLQRRIGGFDDAAGLERLAAPHHRHAADRETYNMRDWELPHRGNPTGTPAAYRPKGSTLRRSRRQATGGDYQAWTPN